MKSIQAKVLFSTILIIGWFSCGQIDDARIDPTRQTEVELQLLAPAVQAGFFWDKGLAPAWGAGVVMHQLRGEGSPFGAKNSKVFFKQIMDEYWAEQLYGGTLKDAVVMMRQAEEEGNTFYAGLAKLVTASMLADATANFGDLPYSEAFQGLQELTPAYDTQESIYAEVQRLLNEAISDFQSGEPDYYGGDLVFDGNTVLWVKTAKALQARYLMHLSKRKPVADEVLSLIDESMQDASEQAVFQFGTAENEQWSWGQFARQRPNTLYAVEDFTQRMIDLGDPRLSKYVTPDFLYGGIVMSPSNDALVWIRADAAIPLVSYSELMFLKAEALLRFGASDTDVEAALRSAIEESMKLVELDATAPEVVDYIDANSSLANTFEQKLERIMQEASVAYFGHNFAQSWVNYRRTGYPELPEPVYGQLLNLNPSGEALCRYMYPPSEYQRNFEEVEKADLRQGGDLLDVELWAFE
jgi:hypothetical protein